ncbi:hypothetical protein H6F75_12470 [Nodosilinea sp. FACHB-131]|uniref:hypothetical protein n=1 Tax=Cyanophyceae TaxID=3028117 RepID=UPI001688B6D7|nr:hypothetical protein [Nodosilinea sp. FACHB-131]MBD1874301.1 hypothetical protein [Nodosilinea sp. FACHB-131]
MTLIYLATGQHPADLPQNDLHVEFKHLTSLSGSFTSWIEWLTDPSLTRRPATAQDARLRFLNPRPEPKATLTIQENYLGTTTRPDSSSIFLKKTQTTLQLKVPLKQIQYIDSDMALWTYLALALVMLLAYLELVSMPFFAIPLNKFWITLLFLVLGLLVGSRVTFFLRYSLDFEFQVKAKHWVSAFQVISPILMLGLHSKKNEGSYCYS